MKDLQDFFAPISSQTYLNTPAVGLIPKSVYAYRNRQYKALFERGSAMMEGNADTFPEVREKIAEVFGGEPGRVALFPAFSYGLNAILEGLEKEKRILLLKDDYPSINWAVEARNFEISYVPITVDMEEHIAKAFALNTPEVFIFSQVQYLNGIKIDPKFIKGLKAKYPETLFIGDGTQYLGTEPFDFKDSGIDVLGASGYKWIGAGLGNGFFMFKPGVEERIRPKSLGYGSILGKYKESGDTLIGRFEGNHLDVANIGSIKEGLCFHQKLGIDKIATSISTLSQKAKEAFTEMNLLEEEVVRRTNHSSIFNLKGDEALYKKLSDQQIVCAQRGKGIRVGFHYYNTEEDLERLLRVLEAEL